MDMKVSFDERMPNRKTAQSRPIFSTLCPPPPFAKTPVLCAPAEPESAQSWRLYGPHGARIDADASDDRLARARGNQVRDFR